MLLLVFLSFVYVVDGIRNNMFEVGAIVIFFNAIVYSLTNMSRIVEESSLLYDTLLYIWKNILIL